MYQSASKIRQKYEISRTCLVNWADSEKIRVKRYGDGGKRIYNAADVEKMLGGEAKLTQKKSYIYARVSSSKQAQDLHRQVEALQSHYPLHTTLKDIGSGLNYKRKNFSTLLERVHEGVVDEIVVSYRDRICRYGFELVEQLCKFNGTKIVVHNKSETEGSQQELSEDLMAVCNFFVARNNGRRAGENKRRKVQEDKAKSVSRMEDETQQMDGDGKVDLQSVSITRKPEKVQNIHEGLPV